MKRFLLYIVLGTLVGGGAFGLFSPDLLKWYYTPPVELGFSCARAVAWGITQYQNAVVVGAILGAIFGIFTFFAMKKPKPAAEISPAVTPQKN